MRPLTAALGFTLACAPVLAGRHLALINGKDLKGWHAQGDCQWSAFEGGIRGVNPNGKWCHLITDSSYVDYAVNLEYRVIRGNTGLYLRAARENLGCCGLEGTQVDIGPSQDGSVMWVADGLWQWYELVTKAPANGWVDYKQWNRLDVELQGSSIKTSVNGHPIWQTANAAKMFPTGQIALQLHDGGKNDTILFRNLDLYLPRRIPGCLDSAYIQYNRDANFAVADSCKTRKPTGLAGCGKTGPSSPGRAVSRTGSLRPSHALPGVELFDLGGRRLIGP